MTSPTFYPGNLQWLGIAKETTPGTAMSAPTIWIPVDSPKHSPKVTPLVDTALRGTMAMQHQQVQGMQYEELGYKTYLYADSVYAHLIAMLGGTDTITGTAPTVTHKTSLYNGATGDNAQPPSYTGFLYEQGGKVAQIAGMKLADLKFDFKANDWPTIDVMWNGMPATYIAAPANTPTALQPLPPFTTAVTIGGTLNSKYSDVSIDIKRDTKPIPVMNGSKSPLGIYAGGMTVTGSLTGVFQGSPGDNDLAALLANTQPALSVAINPDGDATHPFTLQMSKVAYDTADPQGSNNSWMTIQSNIKALGNATDALDSKESPVQAILVNSTATPF